MSMVCGLDLHRRQITFDALDTGRGRCGGAGCGSPTGNGSGAGCVATSLGEPTASRWRWRWRAAPVGATWSRRSSLPGSRRISPSRPTHRHAGRKRRAKTDRSDARLFRELLQSRRAARVVDPADGGVGVAGAGAAVQVVGRSAQGVDPADPRRVVPTRRRRARGTDPRRRPATGWLSDEVDFDRGGPPADRGRLRDDRRHRRRGVVPLKRELQRFGQRQPACRALIEAAYGIGGLIAVAVWSELGDCRRFSRSDQAVRHSGLDVTVDASDRHRAGGYLSRQGPATLRWALFEAAKNASRIGAAPTTPTTARSRTVTTASSPRSPSLASSPGAATTRCATSTPTSSTPSRPDHRRRRRPGPPTPTSRVTTAVSSHHRHARQPPCWTASEH